MKETKLERMQRQVIKYGKWPTDWMLEDVANAVQELAEEQVILGARLELAQRYALRRHRLTKRAVEHLTKQTLGFYTARPQMD